MKILYISSACTNSEFEYIFNNSKKKPGQAVQKFHRLLIEGFSCHSNLCTIEALTSLPVTPTSFKKKLWPLKFDYLDGVKFTYIPFVNINMLKHFFLFTFTFFKVLIFSFKNVRNQNIIICDILNTSIAWSSFIAAKFTRQKVGVIVTDLPSFSISNSHRGIKDQIHLKISTLILNNYDFYIGLTSAMNIVINPHKKPFLLMEGVVDYKLKNNKQINGSTVEKKILLYAGGIYEIYGIKNLVKSFMKIDTKEVELHFYGSGDYVDDLISICKQDHRIKYFGIINNNLMLEKLMSATILINPRPTKNDFTLYSFPSKNLEYMASGTPLLTTKLPGMPKEYDEFVYLIDDETIDGIKKTLSDLISKSSEELNMFGNNAREFVLKNKSNIFQTRKIINFISNNI